MYLILYRVVRKKRKKNFEVKSKFYTLFRNLSFSWAARPLIKFIAQEKHREKSLELQKKKECYNAARQSLSNLDLENEQCKIRLKQKEQELATVYQKYSLEAEEIEAKHRKLKG